MKSPVKSKLYVVKVTTIDNKEHLAAQYNDNEMDVLINGKIETIDIQKVTTILEIEKE